MRIIFDDVIIRNFIINLKSKKSELDYYSTFKKVVKFLDDNELETIKYMGDTVCNNKDNKNEQ
jgi:hypothetical protein